MDIENELQLLSDYKPYVNEYGLIDAQPNSTSDNPVRFSAECLIVINKYFGKNLSVVMQSFVDELLVNIHKCQLKPGLLLRHPNSVLQDSPDDYYAACAVGHIYSDKLAKDIYNYGRKWAFIYNNDGKFEARDWIGRQPALIAHMKNCAGFKLGIFDQIIIATAILISAYSREQDAKILAWFIIVSIKGKYKLIDRVIDVWSKKLKEHYNDGVGDLLGKYYHPAHYEHPNSKWLMGVFQ